MRRPTPLPSPPPRPTRRAPEAVDPAQTTDHDARMDTAQTGPLEPMRHVTGAGGTPPVHVGRPAEVWPGASSELPLDLRADAEAGTPDDGIGVREVWAAARARRKALRAEVRRFTGRQRRRRMVWIGAAAAVVLLVLGTLGVAYSPLFAVQRVHVAGTSTLDAGAVEDALSDQVGVPLPLVDSSAVKAALVQFPLVESYTLEARPPHELIVRIVERTPIGSLSSAAGYTLVDAAGVALSTTPTPPEGHPVIEVTGGVGSPAFDAVGTVFRSLPQDIRAQVGQLSATTANDVTLTLEATGTQIVWGNADRSAEKAVYLAAAMASRPPAEVSAYDVSSPGAVVMR